MNEGGRKNRQKKSAMGGVVRSDMMVGSLRRIGGMLLLAALAGCDNSGQAGGILLSGTVEARETTLAFQVPGRIAALRVDEGQRVEAGDEVALLVDDDYALALGRAKAEVAAAEAALALLEAGARSQELKVAEAALARARAEQRFAEEEVRRADSLIQKQLASQEQLDQAQLRLEVAQAAARQAQQNLLLLREGARREELDRARAQLDALRSAAQTAERQLGYTRLVSQVGGTVSLRRAEAGEVVGAGQPVFSVAELTRPWVRAYLNETDLARVRLGQGATVTVDGLPDRRFRGTLTFISPRAEFTPKSVETRELRVDLVYRVTVELADPEGILKLGMPADVALEPHP
jgi:HlyD family secretion protein